VNALLRRFVAEVLAEALAEADNARVPNQLISRKSKKSKKTDADKKDRDKEEYEKEMQETNVVANIVGPTGPLGAGAEDLGKRPVKPGGKLKKKNKSFVRWK